MEILIVSHKGVASGLKEAAKMIVGNVDQIHVIELTEAGVDVFADELESYLKNWLGTHKGIVLADLKGGTPFNQAEMILSKLVLKESAKVISGANLALVLELLFKEVDINDLNELRDIIESNKNAIDCMELYDQCNDDENE